MLLAAETTLDERYLEAAVQSARVLMTYLHAPKAGLWRDTLQPDGTFIEEPAPASSLYHIAGAIVQMMQTLLRLRTAAAISP
ncbi:MAG: AGE family epimerase/isomerase [Steroidobacteraceae bacterium]